MLLHKPSGWSKAGFAAVTGFVRRRILLLGACAALVAAQLTGLVAPVDNALQGARAGLAQRSPTGTVVVVEIDEKSIQAAGEWPWRRERFATAIRNLRAAGATLVGFDVDFSARSNGDDDAALKAALDSHPGAIVLPSFLRPGSGQEVQPLAFISRHAVVAGVNVEVDPDGKVRHYWRGFQHPTHYRASIASVLAGGVYGETTPFLIDFGVRMHEIDRISFEDIYRGTFDKARIQGRAVLIGATAIELGDRFATPIQPSTPGVYIHALAYEGFMQGRTLMAPSGAVVLGLALLVLLALWPRRGPLDLGRLFLRQGAVLSAVLLLSFVLQAAAPLSANVALVLLAQGLSTAVGVHRELKRRAEEIASQREAHLSFVALHDPETQLPNRRAMLQFLGRELEARPATGEVAVAIAVGIERFPVLRGAIGYASANRVVQSLAGKIADAEGVQGVFHISTSALGVVMFAASEAEARALCERALGGLDATVMIDGSEVETQLRLGVVLGAAPSSPEKLLEQATIALDQARLRNQRALAYDGDGMIDPRLQLAMVSDVGKGLAGGQFRLDYQPKADARTGMVVGAEALMRWRHPVYGVISPDLFIPVAEETGSIDSLTRWALGRIIADQEMLRSVGVDVVIAINISGRSLSDAAFTEHLIAQVRQSSTRLCVEITETAIIANPQAAIEAMRALKDEGVHVSIDDYGSGLSSLSYLKQLAADELKIDKSLIGDITVSQRDRLILKSTIDLAHSLGMKVVAEGVEDEATHACLAAMGCDNVQGYFFSRPLGCDALAELCCSNAKAAPKVGLTGTG